MGSTINPEDPGYFGHIELARPVYHYSFLDIVLNILRSVSYFTSNLLINERDLEYVKKYTKKKKRLKEILRHSKTKICPDTKRQLPVYFKDGIKIVIEHNDPEMIIDGPARRPLSALEAYSILEKITDENF
jgi:DNA-directed RNA polymerase II subunit RPB1